MANPLNTKDAAIDPSPLWIIALFVALSQVTAGSAAIAAEGTVQLIFAIFAVIFPFVVLVAFVCLLLFRPLNLYAPSQYTERTSIGEYAEGLSRQGRDTAAIYRQAVAEAVVAGVAGIHDSTPVGIVEQQAVRTRVTERFDDVIERNSVLLDRSLLIDGAEPVQIPVTADTTADEFLDSVWFNISESVEPYTYNDSWVLADDELAPLREIGTVWARKQGWLGDERRLQDAGIAPGSTYFALPLSTLPGKRVGGRAWRSQLRALTTKYERAVEQEGLVVRSVPGERRPRLVANHGTMDYGLYVMAGRAEASWVTQAGEACEALAIDESSEITPVLALDHKPRGEVLAAGLEQRVIVTWIEGGEVCGAPWREVDES